MRLVVKAAVLSAFIAFVAICGLLGAALIAIAFGLASNAPGALSTPAFAVVMVLLFPLGVWGLYLFMRAARTQFGRFERSLARSDVIQYEDVQAPFVLLLRAFADDDLAALTSPKGLMSALSENRFETWIVDALKPIGRVIAVGKPGEDLPHTGAARLYLDHAVWMDRVASMMERASAIVIFVGESAGVWWEVERALHLPHPHKVAFVFPTGRRDASIVQGVYASAGPPRPHIPRRLADTLHETGFGPMPKRGPHEFVLTLDRVRGARFLRTKMNLRYFVLWLNPVTWAAKVATWLAPAIPWRLSWAGEVSYKRTLKPFVRGLRKRAS